MKRAVRLAPAAARDLNRLEAFLAQRTESAARRAAETLASAIASLDVFSERGRPGPGAGLRELIVPFGRDAYVVQYRIDPKAVVVSRIFHGRERR